jgi:hypothetical protein
MPAERRRRNPAIQPEAREAFLEALAAGWSVTHAARRAVVDRQRFYELRDADEAFADQWDEALEAGTHVLEDEALRRAVEGYDEDTVDGGGNLIRRVRRYDSALLQTLLKGRLPRYREGANVNVTVPTVFVLESAFAGRRPIETPTRELTEGGTS